MLHLIVSLLVLTPAVLFIIFNNYDLPGEKIKPTPQATDPSSASPQKTQLLSPPQSKILPTNYHIFQRYNNCGPAAMSMALRFYGITESQEKIGQDLRPYQVASGDNDDKSVTLEELAEKSKDYGFVPYHRPSGNTEIIKLFITYDIPIITRTITKPGEDIGHYRVVKGYDENIKSIIQDDSLQDKNLWYTYDEFNNIWQTFNYEYLVLVPKEKVDIANEILGPDANEKTAWANAAQNARDQISKNPSDTNARLNLSVALYEIGDFKGSVEEFEKVENRLSFRTLWYQTEPIKAYYELGNYDRVFQLTNSILNNHNRAFSELYIIRGEIYKKQGNFEAARGEFEKALLYNKNLKTAQEALESTN